MKYVINLVAFCNKYQDSLNIDTSNIVLFGHSMGGWTTLKVIQMLSKIKKVFALSVFDIRRQFKRVLNNEEIIALKNNTDISSKYFVLNATPREIFAPVFNNPDYYDLAKDGVIISDKQIVMLDENNRNQPIAVALKNENKNYFLYEIWDTGHSFTNKRVSLANKLISFLDK